MTDYNLFAKRIRLETLKEFRALGFGHVGGAMSVVETLAALYGGEMRIDPKRPDWEDRDWLVMSKGHAGPALYATLALKGYFELSELNTLNQPGTRLPSHCDRLKTPGVDMTTGSLGQGMSTAIGVALGNRLKGKDNYTYLIVGDGELDEGQIWEGAMFAHHYKLNHLIAFVDENKQQLDGRTEDVMSLLDIGAKFSSFGWFVSRVDGHDANAVAKAIRAAKENSGAPSVIILDTVKGKGCTFAEGILSNHHMNFTREQADEAVLHAQRELEEAEAAR